MTNYLHIAVADKFTIPLSQKLTGIRQKTTHKFLFISNQKNDESYESCSVSYLKSPLGKNLFYNLSQFHKLCSKSDCIIIHGATLTSLFVMFPWFISKLCWAINGADIYQFVEKSSFSFQKYVNKFVLSKVKIHVTHIEGDSILANNVLKSKAVFHYSPVYFSNVVDTEHFLPKKVSKNLKVMIGNSYSLNNNHLEVFNNIKAYKQNIDKVICPLSYGSDINYKIKVIKAGRELFGDKFIPLEEFMSMESYKKILNDIDVVIFNHWRQEAMGVTLSLLSLGKIVYVNCATTSYQSLTDRGFQIFDNDLAFKNGFIIDRSVLINKELLSKYYSEEVLIESINNIKFN